MTPKPRKQVVKAASAKAPKTVTWKGEDHPADAMATKWLKKLEAEFERYQSTRPRDAVYQYLKTVYAFVDGFDGLSDHWRMAERIAKKKGCAVRPKEDRISLLIRATSTVNEKTRWKWTMCLAYARIQRVEPDHLKQFIKKLGGINDCVMKAVKDLNG